MTGEYRPTEYWSSRLDADLTLRSTGDCRYSPAYNRWLYRAKRRALRRALRGMGTPQRALDLGSGTGWVVSELMRWGATVDGCDIAQSAVQRLEAQFPAARFFRLELGREPVPGPDAAYGLVTMLDVAYHITDDEKWAAAVQEIGRVLAPGGRFVVSDGLGPIDRAQASHVRFRSLARWTEAAAAAGMQVTAVLPYFRWLSRPRQRAVLRRLPDGLRGLIEYTLESVVPVPPHMRCAVFQKL